MTAGARFASSTGPAATRAGRRDPAARLRRRELSAAAGFLSPQVNIEELERTGDPTRRQALLDAVAQRTPELLDERPKIESLADQFVAGGVVPPPYHGDAIHLAYAYVHDMDALVSWNQHHIVKLKIKRLATAIAQIEGYKPVEILTPRGGDGQ